MTDYILDNAWQQQRQRLAGLEAWFDPGTIRHLEALGVSPGWRCLEIGGGGGSIAEWLCRRVGSGGYVLTTDIDTRFLDALTYSNLEVQRHDILRDPLPEGAFDLVHSRFLLEHLADPMAALRRMAGALKPGGWLLAEATDSSNWLADPVSNADDAALFARWTEAFVAFCQLAGGDANLGRRLYGQFHQLGLAAIGAEGRVFMVRGGSPQAEVWRLTAEQIREHVIDAGLMTASDMERLLQLLTDPEFVWMEALVMAVWGQRPLR
jgi:SAM-dependent methyltransferase